ncbi:C39 family peptidase [Ancylomarina sp. DW003]|nr:hypothetical protein [Ancylomarina sp. DW003]MDE5421094.1 C39 family peptidase [Ancylomarina sp. DW003]
MRKIIIFLGILGIVFSCTDDIEKENSIPEVDFNYSIEIDEIRLTDKSNDLDDDPLTCTWSTESKLIRLSNINGHSSLFTLSELNQKQKLDVTLTVSDTESENSITKTITLPELTEARKIGLGAEVTEEKSNNVDYEWYFDQANTGKYADVNCGPTVATMAIKWTNESFSGIPEDARSAFRPEGGWWYTSDIIPYLNKNNVSNYTIKLPTINKVKEELDEGNIVIICLDMYYITEQKKNNWHVDKFYTTKTKDWGHFIIAKGYKVVDGKVFYEIYDPNGYGKIYSDGSNKGIDRYYRAEDLDISTNIWWDNAIVISRNKTNTKKGIDPSKIVHKSG